MGTSLTVRQKRWKLAEGGLPLLVYVNDTSLKLSADSAVSDSWGVQWALVYQLARTFAEHAFVCIV